MTCGLGLNCFSVLFSTNTLEVEEIFFLIPNYFQSHITHQPLIHCYRSCQSHESKVLVHKTEFWLGLLTACRFLKTFQEYHRSVHNVIVSTFVRSVILLDFGDKWSKNDFWRNSKDRLWSENTKPFLHPEWNSDVKK